MAAGPVAEVKRPSLRLTCRSPDLTVASLAALSYLAMGTWEISFHKLFYCPNDNFLVPFLRRRQCATVLQGLLGCGAIKLPFPLFYHRSFILVGQSVNTKKSINVHHVDSCLFVLTFGKS